jgi:hypothetical protein
MRLLIILGLFFSSLAYGEGLKFSKYPKVFIGNEGIEVTVIAVTPETTNKALVQVRGIDDELDGKVFMHDIKNQGQSKIMTIIVDGQPVTRLQAQPQYWWKQFTLFLPGKNSPVYLYYDEKLSKGAAAEKLQAQYSNIDKKIQENLSRFNRDSNERRCDDDLKKLDHDASKECRVSINTKVLWKTISDEMLKNYSISSYCGRVVDKIASLCRNNPANKSRVKVISTIHCEFGNKMKLTRSGNKITVIVEPETENQDDFVLNYLKNEL